MCDAGFGFQEKTIQRLKWQRLTTVDPQVMHIWRTAVQFEAEPTCKCAMQPRVHQDDPELPETMSPTKKQNNQKQMNQKNNKLLLCIIEICLKKH